MPALVRRPRSDLALLTSLRTSGETNCGSAGACSRRNSLFRSCGQPSPRRRQAAALHRRRRCTSSGRAHDTVIGASPRGRGRSASGRRRASRPSPRWQPPEHPRPQQRRLQPPEDYSQQMEISCLSGFGRAQARMPVLVSGTYCACWGGHRQRAQACPLMAGKNACATPLFSERPQEREQCLPVGFRECIELVAGGRAFATMQSNCFLD